MEIQIFADVNARVHISTSNLVIKEDLITGKKEKFVKFAIRSFDSLDNKMIDSNQNLLIYDYRPETIKAVKEVVRLETIRGISLWGDLTKVDPHLEQAFKKIARVLVKKEADYLCVELYPIEHQELSILFSYSSYIGKSKAEMGIQENNSFWSQTRERFFNSQWEMELIALTDNEHKIIIVDAQKINVGTIPRPLKEEEIVLIASQIRIIKKEELKEFIGGTNH